MNLSLKSLFRNAARQMPAADRAMLNGAEIPRFSAGFRVLALFLALLVFLQGPTALLASVSFTTSADSPDSYEGTTDTLQKNGPGTLTLSGSYTIGTIQLNAGILKINTPGASSSGSLIINGGSVDFGSELTVNNPSVWTADFSFVGTANGTLGAGSVNLTNGVTITTAAGTLTVGGTVTDGG